MKCINCNSTETDIDNQLGHVVCTQCGSVLEQDSMVSEVQFIETKGQALLDGFTLKAGQANVFTWLVYHQNRTNAIARAKSKTLFTGSNSLRTHQDSSEQTRERGHLAIERAGTMQGINLGPNLIEKAKRVFDVALTAKYTKGRRSNCVIAACCYITCRMEQTSHMMIDFADAFSTNVYQIGAVFLQLRRIFLGDNMTMPLVDPGLYMARFAEKLDFGSDTQKVVQNANRVAQRMNRDWITTGRRPAGICAASLFIAARMNGFNRTIREIVLVVKICEGTLRKRLKEFETTDSGKLSTTDFENIMLDSAANPPSFQHQKRKHHEVQEIEEVEDDDDALVREATEFVKQTELLIPPTFEESLSDLDDDPEVVTALAMSDDEQEFKEQLWTAENHDWVEKQLTKQHVVKREGGKKRVKKEGIKAESAAEATRKMVESKPTLSRKINYDVLDQLFQ